MARLMSFAAAVSPAGFPFPVLPRSPKGESGKTGKGLRVPVWAKREKREKRENMALSLDLQAFRGSWRQNGKNGNELRSFPVLTTENEGPKREKSGRAWSATDTTTYPGVERAAAITPPSSADLFATAFTEEEQKHG